MKYYQQENLILDRIFDIGEISNNQPTTILSELHLVSKTNKTQVRSTECDSVIRCTCGNTGKNKREPTQGTLNVLKGFQGFNHEKEYEAYDFSPQQTQRPGRLLCWKCLKLCFNGKYCEVKHVSVQSLIFSFILDDSDF